MRFDGIDLRRSPYDLVLCACALCTSLPSYLRKVCEPAKTSNRTATTKIASRGNKSVNISFSAVAVICQFHFYIVYFLDDSHPRIKYMLPILFLGIWRMCVLSARHFDCARSFFQCFELLLITIISLDFFFVSFVLVLTALDLAPFDLCKISAFESGALTERDAKLIKSIGSCNICTEFYCFW